MFLGGGKLLTEIILNYLVEAIVGGISLAASSIAGAIYLYIKRKDEQISSMHHELKILKQGVNGVLFDILTNIYEEKCRSGYCDIDDRKKIEKLHFAYHKLGGNGTVDGLMEKLQELPTEAKTVLRKVKYAKNIRGNQ